MDIHEIENKTVLIAALDWGMGHTTRCVSIIRKLYAAGNTIVFAGNQKQIDFIRQDFPWIRTCFLEGYNIQLDSRKNTYLQLFKQSIKFDKSIRIEKKWLDDFLEKEQVDIILSDNRYGFYDDKNGAYSILLTHQLNLQVPRFKMTANFRIWTFLKAFSCCWIPDDENSTLSGALSIRRLGKVKKEFIGPLNRFNALSLPIKYDYLIVLSGPEPEKTNFLQQAISFAKSKKRKIFFVGAEVEGFPFLKHPSTKELETIIAESRKVIARAGYTTIMEMIGLNKDAILIPTKGQYEQIYLAKHLKKQKNIRFVENLGLVND